MKKIIFLLFAALVLFPGDADAQGKGKGKSKGHGKHSYSKGPKKSGTVYTRTRVKGGPPPWAPAHGYRAKQHVYFPDYYTFYDPRRSGYVYWNNNAWSFSPTLPSFLAQVDLGRARIQIMGDIPLTTRPETHYRDYYRLYPPQPVGVVVPVPVIR